MRSPDSSLAALLLAALLCPALATGQSDGSDGLIPDQASNQAKEAALLNPLAGRREQIRVGVTAGAEQGFDSQTTMLVGKNVRIEIQKPGADKAPAPAPQAQHDYLITEIAIALVVLAGFLLTRASAAAPPPAPKLDLGDAPFTIVRPLGEGGMGMVYEAIDRNLDRKVAVKRLRDGTHDDPESHRQLIQEAKTVAKLHHPNIVDIHSVVSQGGQVFLVFELIEGKTVQELLIERKRFTFAEARAILDPVCRALEYAHQSGVVHRDLKPANVMITAHGQVKVMDFGIARQAQGPAAFPGAAPTAADFQRTNALSGTLPFLSPESWAGVIRPEGDVYALGVMAYLMLGGAYPFPPEATLEQRMQGVYPRLSTVVAGLPAGIDEMLAAALHPDPDKRTASPRDFRERLAAIKA